MRRNIRFTVQVQRRICHLQHEVKVDTQELRDKLIVELDGLFDMATSFAKGDVTQDKVGDKWQSITPKEQQMWAQVAAKIGMAEANISKGYDERQIDKDLDLLEKLLEETDKLNAKAVAREQLASQIEATKKDDNTKT
jgi:hypothetical protein